MNHSWWAGRVHNCIHTPALLLASCCVCFAQLSRDWYLCQAYQAGVHSMHTGVIWQTQVRSLSTPGSQTKTGSLLSLTPAWVSCLKPLTCQVRLASCKVCVGLPHFYGDDCALVRLYFQQQLLQRPLAACGCLKGQSEAQPQYSTYASITAVLCYCSKIDDA